MVYWYPLRLNGTMGVVNDGVSSGIVAFDLSDPATGEKLNEGAIVNGWFELYIWNTDDSALSSGRGPVEVFLALTPAGITTASGDWDTIAEMKGREDWIWYRSVAFFQERTSMLRVRFDLRTMRRFRKQEALQLILWNKTGSALGHVTNTRYAVIGEFYIQGGSS